MQQYAPSDHSSIELKLKTWNSANHKRQIWKYENADFNRACELIDSVGRDSVLTDDIDFSLSLWQQRFMSIMEECIPHTLCSFSVNPKKLYKSMTRNNSAIPTLQQNNQAASSSVDKANLLSDFSSCFNHQQPPLTKSDLPCVWKCTVVPIPKGKEVHQVGNYRPQGGVCHLSRPQKKFLTLCLIVYL